MKLLFDLTPTQWVANGSGIYTAMVFEKAVESGYKFDCLYSQKLDLPDKIKEIALRNQCKLVHYNNCYDIEVVINKNEYDKIYFGTLSNTECKIPAQVNVLVTLHDLRFMEVPNDKFRYLYRKTLFDRFKQRVSGFIFPSYNSKLLEKVVSKIIAHPNLKIVTVSNHSKYSILQFFPKIPEENINVLYCPYPEKPDVTNQFSDDNFLKENNIVSKKYILIISADRWIKNSFRALKACDELISNQQLNNIKVVVVGKPSSLIISKLKNPKSFIFINYLPNDTLQLLYKNAFCFIYPSLQEGFGIPPIEAMGHGTLVLASAVSSIPEICGDGVLYFNPYVISEIKCRLLYILNEESIRDQLFLRSQERLNFLYDKQKADLKRLIEFIFSP